MNIPEEIRKKIEEFITNEAKRGSNITPRGKELIEMGYSIANTELERVWNVANDYRNEIKQLKAENERLNRVIEQLDKQSWKPGDH